MVNVLESIRVASNKAWYYFTVDATDTKPSGEYPAGSGYQISNGSRLFEKDTEARYEYQDGKWTPIGQTGVTLALDKLRSELKFSITEPYPTVSSEMVRVSVVKKISWETELTIIETGIIYVKDVTNDDELTIENVGIDGISKKVTAGEYPEHTLNLSDPDGNGARAVGYAIVSDGTHEIILYTEEAKATYQQLLDEPGQSHLYPGPDAVNPFVNFPQVPEQVPDGSTT